MAIDEKDDTKIDGEDSDGLDELVKEGEKPDEEKKAGGSEGDGEEGESDSPAEPDETDGSDELASRLEALESKVDEKDAEITFLRGEIAKRGRETEKAKPDDDELNLDDITAGLTDKDPKNAARKIIELANKIADKKVAALRAETNGLLNTTQQINAAKETDRKNVEADFDAALFDNKEFTETMTRIFQNLNKGGRYIPDSLYTAAATAKHLIDKKAAKNGKPIKEVRSAPKNPVEADTHDYSKAKTINDLPASDREKSAMRGALKKMPGVTEKQYVENWLAENV